MGIHTGEVVRTAGRYVGVTLVRALRVCAAASGGQVLLTQATESLLDTDDLGDFRLNDLGERKLPDFERPVRLYEMISPSDSANLRGNHAAAR
jgi:class 3 adenylate cyclase